MKTETMSEYEKQAQDFLQKHGIKFRATLSDTKSPQWGKDGKHGHHYRVTLWRAFNCYTGKGKPMQPRKLTFDFWGSIADAEAGNTEIGAYDVLACISGDAYTPDTFKDFCGEYGYDADSIKALQQFRRCSAFAKRLREFFTEAELQDLQEIQ
jgi:hypothetical protein